MPSTHHSSRRAIVPTSGWSGTARARRRWAKSFGEAQAVDAVALRGQHRLNVFERLLKLLELVFEIAFHFGRDRFQRHAVGIEPLQFGVGAGDVSSAR